MFVVLNEIHSSSGKLKKVRQAFIEVPRHFVAEGRSFSHLSLLQKHIQPHCVYYILYRSIGNDTLCSNALSIRVVSARGSYINFLKKLDICFRLCYLKLKPSKLRVSNEYKRDIISQL